MASPKPKRQERPEYRVFSAASGSGYTIYKCVVGESGTGDLVDMFRTKKLADSVCRALNAAYATGLDHGVAGARAQVEDVHGSEFDFSWITTRVVEVSFFKS